MTMVICGDCDAANRIAGDHGGSAGALEGIVSFGGLEPEDD